MLSLKGSTYRSLYLLNPKPYDPKPHSLPKSSTGKSICPRLHTSPNFEPRHQRVSSKPSSLQGPPFYQIGRDRCRAGICVRHLHDLHLLVHFTPASAARPQKLRHDAACRLVPPASAEPDNFLRQTLQLSKTLSECCKESIRI